MDIELHTITSGITNCFLIKGEKAILVDAGVSGQMSRFLKGLQKTDTKPGEIDLLLLTHGHFDHTGLAKEIAELTGAKTAIHKREKEWVETGKPPLPPGTTPWGKVLATLLKPFSWMSLSPTKVDLALDDEGISLDEYGIPGIVVHTPGHTLGSMSILLENGTAIVGDLAMSAKYMRLTPGMPIFAEDVDLVKESWQKLLDLGAKTIYPAHGKLFSAEVFRKLLS